MASLEFVAMFFFCFVMAKHRKQMLPLEVAATTVSMIRIIGWLLLIVTFYISAQFYGWSIGPAVFFGILAAVLLALIFLLTYRAKIIPYFALFLLVHSFVQLSLLY
ncbi:MAG: DUF3325 domain-containing protein [Paraglaciecola sp.]|uniref:DUF3325 domain-containing protein n=1 Tax=Paraglaciecola sp. TaxID=1920173 RepID=UPI0032982861